MKVQKNCYVPILLLIFKKTYLSHENMKLVQLKNIKYEQIINGQN